VAGGQSGCRFDDVTARSLNEIALADVPADGADGRRASRLFTVSDEEIETRAGADVASDGHWRKLFVGTPTWSRYTVQAVVAPAETARAGLLAALGEDGAGLVFHARRTAPGKAVLTLERIGRDAGVLGTAPFAIPEDGRLHLALGVYDGLAHGTAEGAPVLIRHVGDARMRGRAGVVADGPGARFSEALVAFEQAPLPPPVVNTVFRGDNYMDQWASPSGEWNISDDKQTIWARRDCYGDAGIAYALEEAPDSGQALELLLAGDGNDICSGYRLRIQPAEASDEPLSVHQAGNANGGKNAPLDILLYRETRLEAKATCRFQPAAALADEPAAEASEGASDRGKRFSLWRYGDQLDRKSVV